ncbi:LysR family transcriptional regulator [Brevundimonas sp.]|uniref:LysR family transcriptional regulator n=1 Tax=Brevundimonas sp. TaxID=1871086 RepID=UPI0025C5EA18|nr:LysR family transcriptional regulator [Brevundimonas sp.]
MQVTSLHYFYQAASLGSMRLASDKIGVAVSSISRQIAQLEREMGVALIERGRRTIRLTEAGRLTYEYYQGCMSNEEAFKNRLHDYRQLKAGKIDISIGEGFLGGFLLETIEGFQSQHPGVSVTISVLSTADIVKRVLDDSAHCGLIFNDCNEPKIRVRATAAQPLMVLCAPHHPAAQMEALSLQDISQFDLCLPDAALRIRQLLRDAERREEIWLEPKLTTTSIYVMREAAKAGRMVTVLPKIAATTELAEGSLVARPIHEASLEYTTVSLIHRLGRQLDGAPARLLSTLEAKLKAWSANEGERTAA